MKKTTKTDKYLTDPKCRFFIQQLLETGLSFETNQFKYIREGIPSTAMYLQPDDNGNVRFYVPDPITRDLETYTYGKQSNLKVRDWYMTRWKKPLKTQSGLAKYTPVKGGATRCLFTNPVIQAFNSKKQIKTLFIIEGFKKALSAATNGLLPIIGMNGLSGFKEPGEEQNRLRPEIKQIINTCKVQQVIIIFDSDLFDLGKSLDKPASQRPNQFFRAAIMARLLFEPFADVYLSFPSPHPTKKYGLDDLLLEHRYNSNILSEIPAPETKIKQLIKPDLLPDTQHLVIKDLLKSIKTNSKTKYFTSHKLSALADFKIKSLFHLDNVQSFYQFYQQKLRQKENLRFQYYTRLYQIRGDGTLAETEADNTKHLNIETRFGKLVRLTDKGEKELANFSLRVLFQIDSEDDPKRIVEIVNYDGITRIVEITSKTFVSLNDFQALMISYGDFIWKGNKDDLLDIMTIIFKHEKPATLITQLGYQPLEDFFAFSNGIANAQGFIPVDKYGMVTLNDVNYYFPAWSKFNSRDYDTYRDVKKFSHFQAKKPVTFKQWRSQFVKVYDDQGYIALSFYISTMFSDIVFHHKSGIGFPLLWAAGKPKTGKSTIMTSLLSLFGKPSEAIGLASKSTTKYFINRFAQSRNTYVHLDEYSNTKVNKDVKEVLKNLYDRIGYGRKAFSNDFRTINTPILNTALISGEEIPTDNHALFTRAILLLFNKDKFTPQERKDFIDLRNMEEASLTHITIDFLRNRQLIADNYDDTFDTVFSDFYKLFKFKKFDDRMLKNAAWLVTVVKILMDNEKFDFGIPYKDLVQIFAKNIERQNQYMAANTDVSKFWDIIEMLHARNEITENNGDFRFVGDLIAVRLNRLHFPYALEARKLGYDKILDKSTLQNYLSNESSYIVNNDKNGNPRKIRFKGSVPTRAMFFDYSTLGVDLKNKFGDNSTYEDDVDILPEEELEENTNIDRTNLGF